MVGVILRWFGLRVRRLIGGGAPENGLVLVVFVFVVLVEVEGVYEVFEG
jgi:hypothetical protein